MIELRQLAGADPSLPLLVVGPSLGTSVMALWSPVAHRLAGRFRVVGWDLPGHGERPVLREPVDLADLAADVRDRLPEGPVHLVGFSLGALISQWIARHAPDRVATLSCVSSVCRRTEEAAAQVVETSWDTLRPDSRTAALTASS